MIRINLLPKEDKAQRRVTVDFHPGDLVVPVAILASAALVILGTTLSQGARINGLTKSIADIDAESRAIAPQIEKVNRLAQERAELDPFGFEDESHGHLRQSPRRVPAAVFHALHVVRDTVRLRLV